MPRLLISSLMLVAAVVVANGGTEEALAAQVRGKVVKITCSNPPSGYIRCRSRPLRATVDVAEIRVDGSVRRRSVSTNRTGHFSLRLTPSYYLFFARPPEPGMPTSPVEITVPPQGASFTVRVGGVW